MLSSVVLLYIIIEPDFIGIQSKKEQHLQKEYKYNNFIDFHSSSYGKNTVFHLFIAKREGETAINAMSLLSIFFSLTFSYSSF